MIYDQIIEKIRNLKKEYKIWKEENILIEKEEKNIENFIFLGRNKKRFFYIKKEKFKIYHLNKEIFNLFIYFLSLKKEIKINNTLNRFIYISFNDIDEFKYIYLNILNNKFFLRPTNIFNYNFFNKKDTNYFFKLLYEKNTEITKVSKFHKNNIFFIHNTKTNEKFFINKKLEKVKKYDYIKDHFEIDTQILFKNKNLLIIKNKTKFIIYNYKKKKTEVVLTEHGYFSKNNYYLNLSDEFFIDLKTEEINQINYIKTFLQHWIDIKKGYNLFKLNEYDFYIFYSKYNLTIPYEDIKLNHVINNRILILNTLKIKNIKLRMIIENNNFYLVNEEHSLFGKYVKFKNIEKNINKYKKELSKEHNKNVLFFIFKGE